MLLNGRVKLQVAAVTDWTDDPSVSIQNNAFFRPTAWQWIDHTEGLLSVDITRGIDEYEGMWSQPSPGQITIKSRNPSLNPQTNSQIAYGHKIRVLVDDEPIFTGKIRESDVEYSNFRDDPIVTIVGFDSWQSLLDFEFENFAVQAGETSTGLESPPQDNFIDSNVAALFADAGFGPWYVYSWPLWYLTNSPQPGDIILGYQGGLAVIKNTTKEFASWKVRGSNVKPYNPNANEQVLWWPQVYLEPYTFRSAGTSVDYTGFISDGYQQKLYNFPHVDFNSISQNGVNRSIGGSGLRRSYENLNWFYTSDDWTYNPSTNQYTPPSVEEYRYQYGDVRNNENQIPVVYSEPWTIQNFHRFDIIDSYVSNNKEHYFAQFTTKSTKLIDNLLAFDQGEQGVIYTTKDDNFVSIPRVRFLPDNIIGVPRTNTVEFNSDGSTNSYYNLKVIDGIQNVVNKVEITNVYYSEDPDQAVDMYRINSWKRFDDGLPLSGIVKANSNQDAYEGLGVADINVAKSTTKTYEYLNEESIKRYGERSLAINTNFAWPLYEIVPGEISTPTSWTYWQAAYNASFGQPQLDPDIDVNNTNWRFLRVLNSNLDDERMIFERWNINKSTREQQESFPRNIPTRVDELGLAILDQYSLPATKVRSIVWEPKTDAQIAQAATTEIMDNVAINHTAHGITINDNFRIMGMKHRIDPNNWEIEYQLWDEQGLP